MFAGTRGETPDVIGIAETEEATEGVSVLAAPVIATTPATS